VIRERANERRVGNRLGRPDRFTSTNNVYDGTPNLLPVIEEQTR
jgi:hypothetical protein